MNLLLLYKLKKHSLRKTATLLIAFVFVAFARSSSASIYIVGNNAGNGDGPIETYDFSTGQLINSFIPAAAPPDGNGRAVAVKGSEIFYTELPTMPWQDGIHVTSYGTFGSPPDVRVLPNPRPDSGIQGLAFSSNSLFVLTGYGNDTPEVFKVDPATGNILGGPVSISGPDPACDGFTVLPNGNFLINDDDGSPVYREYRSSDGTVVSSPAGLFIDLTTLGSFSTGTGVTVAPDGGSLYFVANVNSQQTLLQVGFNGQLLASQPIQSTEIEEIAAVSADACQAPVITSQPQSVTVCPGSDANFYVDGTGWPSTFQWRHNGQDLTDGQAADGSYISGSQTAALTVSPVTPCSAGTYQVVVENSCGSATSSPATLTTCPIIINTQFGSTTAGSQESGIAGAGNSPGDVWNWFQIRQEKDNGDMVELDNLVDSTQSPTTVGVAQGDGGGVYYSVSGATDPLLDSWVQESAGGQTLQITNLPAGTYDLYFYAIGGDMNPPINSTFQLVSGANNLGSFSPLTTSPSLNSINTYVEGDQYIVFRGVQTTAPNVPVVINCTSATAAVCNGIQIVFHSYPVVGLTATPGYNSITLTWNAAPEATSYTVYRLDPASNQYVAIATVTDTSYVDSGLPDGTTYSYYIKANSACNSIGSYPVSATTYRAIINLQFGATGAGSQQTGIAASGNSTSDVWNWFQVGPEKDNGDMLELDNLVDSAGNPTTVAVAEGDGGGVYASVSGAFDPLLNSWVQESAGSQTLEIDNLPAGTYDLYFYGIGGDMNPPINSTFQLASGVNNLASFSSLTTSPTLNSVNTYVEGDQYVVFRGVQTTGPSTPVVINCWSYTAAVCNGIQIVKH